MKLIGILLSPYVRRVAVSLNVLGLPFELDALFVFREQATVQKYNPLIRIPALVLEDGTSLVESGAILDEVDRMVDPDRGLIPRDGDLRQRVLQTTAIAIGTAEKAQWALYEGLVRPAEKIHQPWLEHNDKQVLGGLSYLNSAAEKISQGGWICGTTGISQADVTTAVVYTFTDASRPNLEIPGRFPSLSRFVERCESLPAFRGAPFPTAEQIRGWLSQPLVA